MWSICSTICFTGAIIVLSVGYLFYNWITASFDHFDKNGVAFKKPWPIFGTLGAVIFRRESLFDMIVNAYNQFEGKRYLR